MKALTHQGFGPRKTPMQDRSVVTVEAIAEATIQILAREGLDQLTTTRVAARAGVSVGTLYQYYGNKQALLYAVMEVHLARVAAAVEAACLAHRGGTVKALTRGISDAFITAKLERADVSRALYAASSGLQSAALVKKISKRCHHALTAALADVTGKQPADVEFIALILYSAMAGTMRAVLEAGAPPKMVSRLREEMPVLCQEYAAKSLRSS
jgi:AcrR family transcriptional regulator